jgi:hypothetical protein
MHAAHASLDGGLEQRAELSYGALNHLLDEILSKADVGANIGMPCPFIVFRA